MEMDEVLQSLQEDYKLRDGLIKKGFSVNDELEDEIDDLEQSLISSKIIPELESYAKELLKDIRCEIYLAVMKDMNGDIRISNEYDYDLSRLHESFGEVHECEEDDYPILFSQVKFHEKKYSLDNQKFRSLFSKQESLRYKDLHIGDAVHSICVISKEVTKYGILFKSRIDEYDAEGTYLLSIDNPYVFDDVMICCESWAGEDDCGFVAAKYNGKWGVIEVTDKYYLQLIVPYSCSCWQDAAIETEKLLKRRVRATWTNYDEYDSDTMSKEDDNNPTAYPELVVKDNDTRTRRKSEGFCVRFGDGKVIQGKNAKDTFLKTLQTIGLKRIAEDRPGIVHCGYPLVGRLAYAGKYHYQELVDGYYIFVNITNETKKNDILALSDYYKPKFYR